MTGKEFHLISDDRVEEMQTRIAELEGALRNLVDKLDAVAGEITNLTMLAHIHGHRYTGPTYEEELCHARKVLDHEQR